MPSTILSVTVPQQDMNISGDISLLLFPKDTPLPSVAVSVSTGLGLLDG